VQQELQSVLFGTLREAAFNLLPGAGYFLFSRIFGFGNWYEVIPGLPHQSALRIGMSVFGAGYMCWSFVCSPFLSALLRRQRRCTNSSVGSHIAQRVSSAVPPER